MIRIHCLPRWDRTWRTCAGLYDTLYCIAIPQQRIPLLGDFCINFCSPSWRWLALMFLRRGRPNRYKTAPIRSGVVWVPASIALAPDSTRPSSDRQRSTPMAAQLYGACCCGRALFEPIHRAAPSTYSPTNPRPACDGGAGKSSCSKPG